MPIEAIWAAASVPGPLRVFVLPIEDQKGLTAAAMATVATAGRIVTRIRPLLTQDKPSEWTRPAFVAKIMRELELKAARPGPKGQPGRAVTTGSRRSATASEPRSQM